MFRVPRYNFLLKLALMFLLAVVLANSTTVIAQENVKKVPIPHAGLEGNWLVEFSDAGRKVGSHGTTGGYGVKGKTIVGTYSVWPG